METIRKIILGYLAFIGAFIGMIILIGLCAALAAWDMYNFNVLIDSLTSPFALRLSAILLTLSYGVIVGIFLKYNK